MHANLMNKSVNSKLGKTTMSNNSFNTKQNQEYMDMDINRIREFIQILEEHRIKCEESSKFIDAEIAKQKVTQLKHVEKERILNDLKFQHNDELNNYEMEKNNAFFEFNSEWDKNYTELMDKFVEFEERLKIQQQEDKNAKLIELDKKFTPKVKPTSEVLNLQKILVGLVRHKDYIKAHQIQVQIDKLLESDSSSHDMEIERRKQKEVEKIRLKHYQEYQVLVAKKELAEAEYGKNRQLEYDKLLQGFRNRLKEIEMHHSYETMQITNPKKYLARNLNRNMSQPKGIGMNSSHMNMNKVKPSKMSNMV